MYIYVHTPARAVIMPAGGWGKRFWTADGGGFPRCEGVGRYIIFGVATGYRGKRRTAARTEEIVNDGCTRDSPDVWDIMMIQHDGQ